MRQHSPVSVLTPVFFVLALIVSSGAAQAQTVDDADSLVDALREASPGDVVELMPGEYHLSQRVTLRHGGDVDAPITVRPLIPGEAVLHTNLTTLFKIYEPYWQFAGLDFQGGSSANHAFHVVQDAHHTVLEGNRFQNFHSAVKGNGEGDPRRFPDDVRITRNVFVNDAPRDTRWPVVAIDVVGGHGWQIEKNFIADIAQARDGRHGSPGFVKGGARGAVFDSNVVICEWRHQGNPRIGLSLGGGGTSAGVFDRRDMEGCKDDCPEVRDSQMTNNVILNCPEEPGIYLNKARDSLVANNTIYGAFGIQARFPQTQATVQDNLLTGTIWERDGGQVQAENNVDTGWFDSASYIPGLKHHLTHRISDYHVLYPSWISESNVRWAQQRIRAIADWATGSFLGQRPKPFKNWFVAPDAGDFRMMGNADQIIRAGTRPPLVAHDFCGNPRDGVADVGAIQYGAGGCHLLEELVERHGQFFTDLNP